MSWSFTVNADNDMTEIPPAMEAEWMRANPEYPHQMQVALDAARELGLATFTASGGITDNPYTGEAYHTITILGSPNARRIMESVKHTILRGPDDAAKAARDSAVLHKNDRR